MLRHSYPLSVCANATVARRVARIGRAKLRDRELKQLHIVFWIALLSQGLQISGDEHFERGRHGGGDQVTTEGAPTFATERGMRVNRRLTFDVDTDVTEQ